MIYKIKEGVAMLFLKRPVECGVFMITQVFFQDAYT